MEGPRCNVGVNMNKRNLIREITRRSKISENQVNDIFYALIKNIEKGLIRREKINIRDFGVFKLYFRKEFSSSLPGGKKANVHSQHIVRFIPGKTLRTRIDPSFPRVVKPKRRSIFGFLGRFASPFGKKTQPEKQAKSVEVPVEKVKFQEEKVEVRNPEPERKPSLPKPQVQMPAPAQKETAPPPKLEAYQQTQPQKVEISKPQLKTNMVYYQKRSEEKKKREKEIKKPTKEKTEKIDLKNKKIDKKILALVPEYIARLYKAVPIEMKGGKLVIAMSNPEDLQAAEFIKKKINRDIEVVGAQEDEIKSVLDRYSGIEGEIEKALAGSQFIKKVKTTKIEKERGLISEEAPTSKIVKSLLTQAARLSASDVHIEPKEFDVGVRFRVDGVLQNVTTLPKSIQDSVITKIKILSRLKIDETRLPQDGRFKIKVDEKEIDLRISTFPTVYGEKVVMRLLDKSKGILTLEELGMRGSGFKIVEENIHKSHGMTLVTGPTGSGKTTTLYAIIDRLNNAGLNIITLEDPVEYQIEGVNQGQINPKIGFGFASGLRSILRQDPDVVMVGEIRDFETAEMAVQAALTGHIVLSTLHTNDAAGTIPRLIDMKVEPFLLISSVNTIIAQRLVRKICENCVEEDRVSDIVMKEIKDSLDELPEKEKRKIDFNNLKFYKGRGCEICNSSGYKGRVGLFEVLPMSIPIQEITLKKSGSQVIEEEARKEGMVTLKQDGILKSLDKITSIEEIWRVTKD